MSDLRARIAMLAEGLEELVPGLREAGNATPSTSERLAWREAEGCAHDLARKLRALVHFAGGRAGGGRTP